MSTHHLTEASPRQQPAKKLRSCLSPSRSSRSISPDARLTSRSPSTSSADSLWYRKRKCVRWEGEIGGSDVTCYFATYSATEYDRTPLAPPSEAERACVLPARGSRCLNFNDIEEDEDDDGVFSDSESGLPPSPFATPEDSEEEGDRDDGDEWSECFARRRMMFARLCPTREGPQFEGYRSLSATLVNLLRSVEDSEDDERVASREQSEDELEDNDDDADRTSSSSSITAGGFPVTSVAGFPVSSSSPVAMGDLFLRLRESSADSDTGTPSLVSSADSDGECSRLASPRGSAIEFVPGALPPWKQPSIQPTIQGTYIHVEL